VPRTVCMISPANTASLRVAEKIGFQEFSRGKGPSGEDVIFFFRERSKV
jgi:RimJ/RimL family protein N-acetyltransferase